MPRRPNDKTSQASHCNVIPIKWYFCPVETCRKSLPSKTAYTRHIRSNVRSDLDFVNYNMPQPTNNDQLLSSDSDQVAGMQVDFDPVSPSSNVLDDYEVYHQQSPLLPQPSTSPRQTRSSSQVTESNSTQRPSFRLPEECLPDRIEYHSYIYGKILFFMTTLCTDQ
jgi:hypothetical protein